MTRVRFTVTPGLAGQALDEILNNAIIRVVSLSRLWLTLLGDGEVLVSPGQRRLRQIRGRSGISLRVVPTSRGDSRINAIDDIQ